VGIKSNAVAAVLSAAFAATPAIAAATPGTDFGVRVVPGPAPAPVVASATQAYYRPLQASGSRLGAAVALARSWGRVTSTVRSPARNRAVGGVRNSYHLAGRAIDVARHAGVRHAEIDAAFRRAGYHLLESLDEGDHSHFAFGWDAPSPQRVRARPAVSQSASAESTRWRVVAVPQGLR
jgi:hypothetical protein